MWNSSRRIALLGTSVVLVAGGVLGFAWIANWLPISFGDAESGRLVDESDLDRELADLTESQFDGGAAKPDGNSDSGKEMFADQDEPIFEPVESSSNEFGDRKSWLNNRTAGNAARKSSAAADPFAPFPDKSQRTGDRSIPDRFPLVAENSNNQISGNQFETETEPHQLVNQAAFAASNARDRTRSASGIFSEGPTRTLSESQSFPSDIQLTGNAAPPKSNNDSPTFEGNTPFGNADSSTNSEIETARIVDQNPANRIANNAASETGIARSGNTNKAAEPNNSLNATELKAKLAQIDQWLKNGDYVSAHRDLSSMYWSQPEVRPVIQERLDRNSQKIYFSPHTHFLKPYEIQGSDLLQTIAPKYKLSWTYLAAMNEVDPRRVRVGQKLKVIKGPFSAFVDLSDFELTIHCHGFYVKRYDIGVGKDNSSPVGRRKVMNKVTKPQYTDPNGRVIAGDDPANPLGTHWIDIGNSFGIHGTLNPDSIGKAKSRGCIRLKNKDIAEVYMFLVKDSEVVIRP